MPTIGLAMMAKNEAQIISRALNSARPLIDYALITDTGSTDGTQQVVADWLQREGVPGKVVEVPWRDFGYNRSHVLAELRKIPDIDYALMVDADEVVQLSGDPSTLKQQLTEDCYQIDIHYASFVSPFARLTRNRRPFLYRGPGHEWLDCETKPYSQAPLASIALDSPMRIRDPDSYRREAKLYEDVLKGNLSLTERGRYMFYVANSWRDCGEPRRALRAYWQRIGLGGWQDEVYVSLLMAAHLYEQLGHPFTEVMKTYKRAIAIVPERAEAMYRAARACRLAGRHHEGYVLAKQGITLPLYKGFIVEPWIYEYGLLDEFAVNAYWAGAYQDCLDACERILRERECPEAERPRIEANAAFARQQLGIGVTHEYIDVPGGEKPA